MSDSDRLANIQTDLATLTGQVQALTTLLGAYQAQQQRLEDRVNKGLGSAVLALFTAILGFLFRKM